MPVVLTLFLIALVATVTIRAVDLAMWLHGRSSAKRMSDWAADQILANAQQHPLNVARAAAELHSALAAAAVKEPGRRATRRINQVRRTGALTLISEDPQRAEVLNDLRIQLTQEKP